MEKLPEEVSKLYCPTCFRWRMRPEDNPEDTDNEWREEWTLFHRRECACGGQLNSGPGPWRRFFLPSCPTCGEEPFGDDKQGYQDENLYTKYAGHRLWICTTCDPWASHPYLIPIRKRLPFIVWRAFRGFVGAFGVLRPSILLGRIRKASSAAKRTRLEYGCPDCSKNEPRSILVPTRGDFRCSCGAETFFVAVDEDKAVFIRDLGGGHRKQATVSDCEHCGAWMAYYSDEIDDARWHWCCSCGQSNLSGSWFKHLE